MGFVNRSEAPDTKRVGVGGRKLACFGKVFFAILTAVPVSKWLEESNSLGSFGDWFAKFGFEFLALVRRISFPTLDRLDKGGGWCGLFATACIAAFRVTVGLLKRSMVVNINGDGDRCTGSGICKSFSSSLGGGFNRQFIAIARACVGRLNRSMTLLLFDFVVDGFRSLVIDNAT